LCIISSTYKPQNYYRTTTKTRHGPFWGALSFWSIDDFRVKVWVSSLVHFLTAIQMGLNFWSSADLQRPLDMLLIHLILVNFTSWQELWTFEIGLRSTTCSIHRSLFWVGLFAWFLWTGWEQSSVKDRQQKKSKYWIPKAGVDLFPLE